VPDMLGFGLSDKPQEEIGFKLDHQVDILTKFIDKLQIDQFDLVVHGWGATTGLAYSLENQLKVRKIIALNGLAFSANGTRLVSLFSRTALFSLIMVRLTNAFLRLFLRFTAPEMSNEIIEAYLYPYRDYHSRFGIQHFLNEIPFFNMQNNDNLYAKLSLRIAELYNKDVLIVSCQQDSLTGDKANSKWRQRLPNARYVNFKYHGLFMLEEPDNEVIKFLDNELKDHE
ncbi:MAG: alpha/beta fold hydrolase, partial [Lentisphaeria bacterium]